MFKLSHSIDKIKVIVLMAFFFEVHLQNDKALRHSQMNSGTEKVKFSLKDGEVLCNHFNFNDVRGTSSGSGTAMRN